MLFILLTMLNRSSIFPPMNQPDDDETFDLTPQEESLLLASIREAEQGRVVEASVVLREIGRR